MKKIYWIILLIIVVLLGYFVFLKNTKIAADFSSSSAASNQRRNKIKQPKVSVKWVTNLKGQRLISSQDSSDDTDILEGDRINALTLNFKINNPESLSDKAEFEINLLRNGNKLGNVVKSNSSESDLKDPAYWSTGWSVGNYVKDNGKARTAAGTGFSLNIRLKDNGQVISNDRSGIFSIELDQDK